MSERITEVLDRIEARQLRADEPRSALEYCQDVYKGRRAADPWRMRAAIAALPFESPKLTAMTVSSMNGQDFAVLLERAIARSETPEKSSRSNFTRSRSAARASALAAEADRGRAVAVRRRLRRGVHYLATIGVSARGATVS